MNDALGMLFSLAVLCIIFGSIFGFPVLKERIRLRNRELDMNGGAAAQELLDQIRRLEERIEVLERIVTDDKADLRRQFRDLGA